MPRRSPAARLLLPLGALLVAACGGGSKAPLGLLGADCLSGRDESCTSKACLVLDSSTAYCSQACQKPVDCPDGYLCLQAGTAGGATLCQARGAGGVCGADDDCPAGLRCDAGPGRCYVPVTRSACGGCTSDKQCGAGGTCHSEGAESFCAPPCAAGATPCPTGYACKADASAGGANRCLPANGSCRGGRPLCAPCAGDLECGKPGDLCVRNLISQESFCGTRCTGDADCPKSFACADLSGNGSGPKQCVPVSGTCAGYCDSADAAVVTRECGLGASCDLTNRACVRATDGSLCSICQSDDDCKAVAGARCLVNRTPGSPFQGEKFCGTDCSQGTCPGAGCTADAGKCGSGFFCAGIGPNAGWPYECAPASGSCAGGFGKLGDSCDRHRAPDCATGICAQFGVEKRCSAGCQADGDCGDARWRCCLAVGSDKYDCSKPATPSAGGVCAPVGGSFGDDCAPGHAPCQDGLCLDIGTARLCTKGCDPANAASCPTGFSCQGGKLKAADGSDAGDVKVCFPDGGGGVGSACVFGPAACKSHLCIKKESGNVCTKPCTAAAECPADWTCGTEAKAAGGTVTVCLPPGTGP